MKIARIISIVMILLEQETITATELAKMLGVSKRTIYRDINDISLSGVPIIASQGPNGGIGIMKGYKFDKRLFTTSDISTLLIGLGIMNNAIADNDIHLTVAKIKNLIPKEQQLHIEYLANQVLIDISPRDNDENLKNHIGAIKGALNEKRIISFEYINNYGDVEYYDVEPYRVVNKNASWYLHCFCLVEKEYKVLRLSAIKNIIVSEDTFRLDHSKLNKFNKYLHLNTTPMIEAKISISKKYRGHFINCFGEESVSKDENGNYTAIIKIPDNESSYRDLLALPPDCYCIEPLFLKDYLAEKIKVLNFQYGINK